ncbi:MAG: tryptophan 2,3-dioxygenase family protein [Planctomycetota bacterium]|nr:tryptophan 2,3-dioxygenase family protein [Planctomycetota bacterium]
MGTEKRVNYWEYIRVDDLLSLQGGVEGDEASLGNDEVMFIVVHQVYELWFKLILRELGAARELFSGGPVAEQALSGAVHALRRVCTIIERCVDHFQIMETLSTRDYLSFRDKLMPASGFQSAQLRQIEILLGLEDKDRLSLGVEGDYMQALRAHDGTRSSAYDKVEGTRASGPSLRSVIAEWLYRTPIDGYGPDDEGAAGSLDRFIERYLGAVDAEIAGSLEVALSRSHTAEDQETLRQRYAKESAGQAAFLNPTGEVDDARTRRIRAAILFITTYRELPLLSWPRELLDAIVEFEQLFVIFRQRHARMVERVIGRRTGTGGSAGVDYLDATALKYRIFKDVWACRTCQIQIKAAPPLERPDFYGFVAEGS